MLLALAVLLASCASQTVQEPQSEPKGENLMRYARNVAVYEAD